MAQLAFCAVMNLINNSVQVRNMGAANGLGISNIIKESRDREAILSTPKKILQCRTEFGGSLARVGALLCERYILLEPDEWIVFPTQWLLFLDSHVTRFLSVFVAILVAASFFGQPQARVKKDFLADVNKQYICIFPNQAQEAVEYLQNAQRSSVCRHMCHFMA